MAIIDKRFVHFKTRAAFNTALDANEILSDSIVFIADEKLVYTHGSFYSGVSFSQIKAGSTILEASDIDSMVEFLAGDGLAISVDQESGQITYKLAERTVANVEAKENKFINSITFDAYGRVVSVGTADVVIPEVPVASNIVAATADATEATAAEIANGNVRINTIETTGEGEDAVSEVTSSINILGKDKISVTATAAGAIEVAHDKLTVADGGTTTPETDTVDVLSALGTDEYGHATQIAKVSLPTKAYVDAKLGAAVEAALILKGVLGDSEGMVESLPAEAEVGHVYKVGKAGAYAGEACQIGDVIICVSKDPVEWVVLQNNVDIATDTVLGLVKGGYVTDEENRNFAVSIAADGSMFVHVPYEAEQESKNVVSDSATGTADVAEIANGNVHINHLEDDKVTSSHVIKGAGATTVKAVGGEIVIESANDNDNTTYEFALDEKASKNTLTITPSTNGVAGAAQVIEFNAWFEGE
jgi:hypothetical protein